jgi:hypothetical protein
LAPAPLATANRPVLTQAVMFIRRRVPFG